MLKYISCQSRLQTIGSRMIAPDKRANTTRRSVRSAFQSFRRHTRKRIPAAAMTASIRNWAL